MEFEYSKTFINCKVRCNLENEEKSPRGRCHSSPPYDRAPEFPSIAFEHQTSEEVTRAYVDSLGNKVRERTFSQQSSPGGSSETTVYGFLPHLSPTSCDDVDTPTEHAQPVGFEILPQAPQQDVEEVKKWMLPSKGSLGHPEACRRPCIYFLQGNCENGDGCVYCHLPHLEKTPKLDKRQRTIIQGLERCELIALVYRFCAAKAEDMGFTGEAAEILKLLEEESIGARPLSDSISERDIRNLHKTLARMNFSNLICLVTHQSPNRAGLFPESAERLSAALENLRPRLALRVEGRF